MSMLVGNTLIQNGMRLVMKSADDADSAEVYVVLLSNIGRSLRMIARIPNVGLQPNGVFAGVGLFVGFLADSQTNLVVAGVAVARHVHTLADELLGFRKKLLNGNLHGRRGSTYKTGAQQEERDDHALHTSNENKISYAFRQRGRTGMRIR